MDTNLLQHLLRKAANQVFNVLSLLIAEIGVLHHSCGGGGANHQIVQNILLDCDAAVVQDLLKVHHLCQTKIVPISQQSGNSSRKIFFPRKCFKAKVCQQLTLRTKR